MALADAVEATVIPAKEVVVMVRLPESLTLAAKLPEEGRVSLPNNSMSNSESPEGGMTTIGLAMRLGASGLEVGPSRWALRSSKIFCAIASLVS